MPGTLALAAADESSTPATRVGAGAATARPPRLPARRTPRRVAPGLHKFCSNIGGSGQTPEERSTGAASRVVGGDSRRAARGLDAAAARTAHSGPRILQSATERALQQRGLGSAAATAARVRRGQSAATICTPIQIPHINKFPRAGSAARAMRVPLLVAALAACLLALAGAPTAAEPAAAAAPLPPLPAWARGPSYRGTGQWKVGAIVVGVQGCTWHRPFCLGLGGRL